MLTIKRLLLSVTLILFAFAASAQTSGITGYLSDQEGNTLPGATLMLLNAQDSTMEKFTISGKDGSFKLDRVKPGDYLLQVSFVGFGNISRPVSLRENELKDLGKVEMTTKDEVLENVVIEADRIPIVIKKDTIEYAADAFATRPGANVEDLLKKLPGIEVEADGTIKAQGETVNKVLVDGKEFFGDDPQIATKNLPADAMDKVQVFDKLSEMAEFTGVDDGTRNKTINLTLKEDKKKGLFGNVEGGYGQDNRYQGKLNLNQFSKKRQVSVIASGNNVNQQNFSLNDYISMSGGLSNMMAGGGGGSFSLNLDNGLGAALGLSNGGINNNISVGANLNQELSEKTELSVNYFFNDLQSVLERNSSRQNFNGNDFFSTRNDLSSDSRFNLHRMNTQLKIKSDETQDLTFRSSVKRTSNKNESDQLNLSFSDDTRLLTSSMISQEGRSAGLTLENSVLYRKKFAVKGRSFTTRLSGNLIENDRNAFLNTLTAFPGEEGSPVTEVDQQQTEVSGRKEWEVRASYTEPVLNGKLLQGFISHSRVAQELDKDFFDLNGGGRELNEELSAGFENTFRYHTGGLRLFFGSKKSKVTLGVRAQNSILKGNATNVENILTRSFFNILPGARWRLDLESAGNLNVDYNTSVRPPSLEQLQPVVDNSDPLFIYNGNPNLDTEFVHRLNLNYSLFDQFSLTSIFFRTAFTYTENKITNQSLIDDLLRQVVTPVNVDNDLGITGDLSFSTPMRWMKAKISLNLSGVYNRSILFVNSSANTVERTNQSVNAKLENRNKRVVDAGIGVKFSRNRTHYLTESTLDQTFLQHSIFASMDIYVKKKWTIGGNFSQEYFSGESFDDDLSFPLLSASVSRTFLKLDRAELKLSVFDLLNTNQGISRNSNFNFIEEERVNVLNRYFMISFRYKISKFRS